MTAHNVTLDEQIAAAEKAVGAYARLQARGRIAGDDEKLHEFSKVCNPQAILATLQSIKDAGDDVVEPPLLRALRDPVCVFGKLSRKDVDELVQHIDTLLSAYKRVCVERDEAREAAQTWAKSHNMQMERAEKAEAERDEFRKDAERHLKERDLLVSEYERAVKCGEQGYVHAVMHLYNAITNAKIDAAIDSARNK